MDDLIACTGMAWSPRIGDPGILGWITVAAYCAAAIALLFAAQRLSGSDRWIWRLSGGLLLVLMVNKQLDLQSALTALGRCHARLHGWYDDRAAVQLAFIAAILVLSCLFVLVMLSRFGALLSRSPVLWAGHVALLTFVAIRAVGFSHVDQFIGYELGFLRMNHVLELGALALFLLAAALKLRRAGRRRRR